MIWLELCLVYLKIGILGFGGGYAMLSLIQADVVDRYGWISLQEFTDIVAISQMTPGPIGINMATYTGYVTAGIPGSVAATIGVITPGIIIVLLIVAVLDRFRKNKYVEGAFYGLRPASTGLIAAAGILVIQIALLNLDFYKASGNIADILNYKAIILAAVLLVLTRWFKPTKKLHPIIFIATSAVVGILIF